TYDVNPFFIIFLKNLPSFRPIILVIGRDTFLLHLGLLPGHRAILHRIADFIGDGAVPGLSQVAAVNSHHYNSSFPSSSFFYSPPSCCRAQVFVNYHMSSSSSEKKVAKSSSYLISSLAFFSNSSTSSSL